MTQPKFLQLHYLHSYSGVLLNRDEQQRAKRLTYGGVPRTRISSQSRKFHWRHAEGEFSLSQFGDVGFRSREVVTQRIMPSLRAEEIANEEVLDAVTLGFQVGIYGDKGAERASRQPLHFGEFEVEYFRGNARQICQEADDAETASKATNAFFTGRAHQRNLLLMREQARVPQSLTNALFGRMVTNDALAGGDGAVFVAHPFTVHAEQPEKDFFSAVDELADTGAGHIGDVELNSGVFYSYIVVDTPQLVANVEGCERSEWETTDLELTAALAANLVGLIATESQGAKLGSTAPFTYASFIMAELGARQPRSLAEAFQVPTEATTASAVAALTARLQNLDRNYGPHEARRFMGDDDVILDGVPQVTREEMADWVEQTILSREAK